MHPLTDFLTRNRHKPSPPPPTSQKAEDKVSTPRWVWGRMRIFINFWRWTQKGQMKTNTGHFFYTEESHCPKKLCCGHSPLLCTDLNQILDYEPKTSLSITPQALWCPLPPPSPLISISGTLKPPPPIHPPHDRHIASL